MSALRKVVLAGLVGLLTTPVQAEEGIVVGLSHEPPHLDPTGAAAGAIDQVLYANVFEGLTRVARDGSVRPGLAETWTVSASGKEYIFRLNAGITFHDGTEMDAGDVKFSFERAQDEALQNAQKAAFDIIKTVDVIGPLLIKITLKEPKGDFLFNLALGDAVIVAPESIGEIRQKPIGTGAFKFRSWVQGEQIELERNPDYWGEPAGLDHVTFRFISDPQQAFAAMMAQELDAFPNFPALENLTQFEADPKFQVLVGSTGAETILAINNKQEPFDDIRVRRAIAHAIDRKVLIRDATSGLAVPIGTHFPPYHPDYVDLLEKSPYDPALAAQLLEEAGFEDGFEVTLKLPPTEYASAGGDIIAEQLRAVGVETEIIHLGWPEWLEQVVGNSDFGLSIVSHPEPLDIRNYARPDYYFQYDDPVLQAVISGLNAETDRARRSEWLTAAQRLISEGYVNAYLFQEPFVTVADARLRGLWQNAPLKATDLTGVSWGEKALDE
ncbi:ABC transporter substrate-binding protein [Roseovarius aestuarii]|uniref:Glutathione-binding protein GsiB n=1 Tax=Roseovarius aestuarii TaxID=475083 RepID=A0A1X7BT11_9RHOB|nr:ABC transporter substrate-binding protein [Roseovarius aestuarii]SMC12781.1 Glutathione-binding protein GsiB precursor [Roseovarius aestuarii]